MTKQNPYRAEQDSEDQWRRDYGHRNQQHSGTAAGVIPSAPDYSRESAIERDLRDSDYPQDGSRAPEDHLRLDFGTGYGGEVREQAQPRARRRSKGAPQRPDSSRSGGRAAKLGC